MSYFVVMETLLRKASACLLPYALVLLPGSEPDISYDIIQSTVSVSAKRSEEENTKLDFTVSLGFILSRPMLTVNQSSEPYESDLL